tara:strand:- start:2133 stop:2387 length:255 start_codon:yes stop_codon:yes gene_type:complete
MADGADRLPPSEFADWYLRVIDHPNDATEPVMAEFEIHDGMREESQPVSFTLVGEDIENLGVFLLAVIERERARASNVQSSEVR